MTESRQENGKRGLRLNTLIILWITVVVSVILLVALLIFYRSYRTALMTNAMTTGQQSVAQAANTMNDYLDGISSRMNSLSAALNSSPEKREDFFESVFRIMPEVAAISTYDKEGGLVNIYSRERTPRENIEVNLSFDLDRVQKEPAGYLSLPHAQTLFEGYYPWVITLVRPVVNAETGEKWLSLDISCSNIAAYINDVGIGQRGYCFLMENDGGIVYHPQQQLLYSSLKEENTELISSLPDGSTVSDNVIYTIQTLHNENWKVVGVSYVQEMIDDSLLALTTILLLAGIIILGAAILISSLLSRQLTMPLKKLEDAMQQFEADADNFSYTPSGGTREVQNLGESFAHMAERVQDLLAQVRQEEVNLRKTELKALQAQINPHFLYNTLDSISWMCEQGKDAEAVQMVGALARLFRISISKGREMIPIRSELQHAESYLQIQAQRYKDQFTYEFDVDDSCLDYLCNKITLQPIIENAIYHGINGLVDDGEIIVTVREDGDDILFIVSDNGSGMSEERIHEILSRDSSDRTGIGVKNVDERLKIYFGPAYGITIESVPDEGTQVYIRMPKVVEDEYEK